MTKRLRLVNIVLYIAFTIELLSVHSLAKIKNVTTEASSWNGFENNTVVNISSQLGTTAFLPCSVRIAGDKQISWIRRRDWHVLSSGSTIYSNDQRFSVYADDGDNSTLVVRYLQARDNGTYECQISTGTGVVSRFVNLLVIVPEAFIHGNSEYHVQAGSSINLFCTIEQSPIPPQYIFWRHNERLLNYEKNRGGISINTEHGPQTKSRLIITGASLTDSGNYTCGAPNTEPGTVHVFVSQGDKTAAILRRTSSGTNLMDFYHIPLSWHMVITILVTKCHSMSIFNISLL